MMGLRNRASTGLLRLGLHSYPVSITPSTITRANKEWRHQQEPHFALDYLPPYSPELNPIERVRKRTRRKCVHNVYFPKLQALIEKVDHQFVQWSEPNDELAAYAKYDPQIIMSCLAGICRAAMRRGFDFMDTWVYFPLTRLNRV